MSRCSTFRKFSCRFALVLLCAPLLTGFSFEALFAPRSYLLERWAVHDAASKATVDHSEWDRLLKLYVVKKSDGINRFAYKRISKLDRRRLDEYIRDISKTKISKLNRDEQFAFWVNLYNARTVKVILDHPNAESIRDIDISPGFLADGPWGKKMIVVEETTLSLNDIEHGILRPIYKDPYIHYAVNCASISCPNLLPVAFSAKNYRPLLDKAARAYVNHPRGVTIEEGQIKVSSIYVWFAEDFGGETGVLEHIKKYVERERVRVILHTRKSIAGHSYDWSLNGDR
jgi:hypothetical protein